MNVRMAWLNSQELILGFFFFLIDLPVLPLRAHISIFIRFVISTFTLIFFIEISFPSF